LILFYLESLNRARQIMRIGPIRPIRLIGGAPQLNALDMV